MQSAGNNLKDEEKILRRCLSLIAWDKNTAQGLINSGDSKKIVALPPQAIRIAHKIDEALDANSLEEYLKFSLNKWGSFENSIELNVSTIGKNPVQYEQYSEMRALRFLLQVCIEIALFETEAITKFKKSGSLSFLEKLMLEYEMRPKGVEALNQEIKRTLPRSLRSRTLKLKNPRLRLSEHEQQKYAVLKNLPHARTLIGSNETLRRFLSYTDYFTIALSIEPFFIRSEYGCSFMKATPVRVKGNEIMSPFGALPRAKESVQDRHLVSRSVLILSMLGSRFKNKRIPTKDLIDLFIRFQPKHFGLLSLKEESVSESIRLIWQ